MNHTFSHKDGASALFSSRRLAPMLLALLTFLTAVSLSWNIIDQRNAAIESARLHAKTVFEKDTLFRRWNALLGGVYAPVSGKTEPNPYLEGVVRERDLKTPSGRELTLVNPEFMTRQVFELEEKGKGVLGHLTSLNPIRPENAADPWEREALLEFEKGAKEVSSLEMINGREYMRLMRPLVTEEECLKCHGNQGYKEGDIRGGLSVSVPMEPHWAAFSSTLKKLLFWHIFLWLCVAGVIYTGYRYQKRSEEYRRQYENIFNAIAENISVKTGAEYFDTAVKFIANELGIEYAFIGEFDAASKRIKTVSLYAHGERVENIEYDLSGTPCENVMSKSYSPYPGNIQKLFPEDKLLVQMKAESYAGMPLFSSDGRPLGLISVVSCAPMDERMVNKAESLLHIFAARASAELERRESERRLKESEKKFRDMAEVSLVGVYLIQDGIFRYCNNKLAEIFGYTSEELIDKKGPEDLVYPEDWHIVRENLRRRVEGEIDSIHYSFRGITKDRKIIYVDVYGSKTDYQGRPAVLGTLLDITERVLTEEQLRHSQKMEAIGTLAGGIAHDFNNILNVIMGYGNMIIDKLETDNPLKEQMTSVLTAAEKAANLTKKLLSFSRKQTAELKPININDTVLYFQKMLVRIIKENIDLHLDIMEKPLIVMADAVQIEQVIMNLASNACDAMPEGGRLTIGTGIEEIDDEHIALNGYGTPRMYALITVADTGHGMDAETMTKIFDPFFTTKGIEKGTGLGLAVSYGIIKQHNGFIKAYSEPGQGTLFKIYLPLIEEPFYLEMKTGSADTVSGGDETILVAEDDASLRNLARIVLESFGYSVITAENGEDAVRKFIDNRDVINLAVLDMIMPKKSGKETYAEIKNIRPDIKAVFVSGYTMDIVTKKELTDESVDFIPKPVSPKDLLKKVREILDRGGDTDG